MPGGIWILEATGPGLPDGDALVACVKAGFNVPVGRRRERLDLERTFEPARGQYDATALLGQVLACARAPDDKLIAVVDVDLFIPVLTFVFGQAQLGGVAAVVSSRRLASQFYGLPEDAGLLRARIEKEVVHELGHLFGLYHCHQFECVMRSSTYVEEMDFKRAAFCPDCEARIAAVTRAA